MVVLTGRNPGGGAPLSRAAAESTSRLPSAASRAPAMRRPVTGSRTSPTALTTMSAAVTTPSRSTRETPGPGRGARGVAHGAIRPDAMVAHVQIEDDGARDVRHHGAGDGEAPAVLLEILHGAPDGLEAEGATSCQDDAVHHRRQVAGVEELDAVDPRRPAGDLERAHRRPLRQDGRAAGERPEIGDVAHVDSRNHSRTLAKCPGTRRLLKKVQMRGAGRREG